MQSAVETVPAEMDRAEKIAYLRQQMAKFQPRPTVAEFAHPAESSAEETLSLAGTWAEILSPQGVPRREVTQIAGSPQGLMGCVAGLSAAGNSIALVGFPDVSWAAAYELGAQLDNLVWVPRPGTDAAGIAMVLAPGFDVVVADFAESPFLTPQRARRYEARLRDTSGALVVADCQWPQAPLKISTRLIGADGMQHGYGRLSSLNLQVCTTRKHYAPQYFQWTIGGSTSPVTQRVQQVVPLQRQGLHHAI